MIVYCNRQKKKIIELKDINSSSRLISVASRLLADQLQKTFKENGLKITVEEWRLLFYLWQEDGINQKELALKASKEKSTITRQINELQKKGLILRQNEVDDKRNKLIFLTEEAVQLEKEAMKIARDITGQSESGISREDLLLFEKVIKKIIGSLQEL